MHNDKTTLKDLSIFTADPGGGVFGLLDHTTTHAGKEMLRKHIYHPPGNYNLLVQLQQVIRFWSANPSFWPESISNGTLVMLEKFFESADNAAPPGGGLNMLLGAFFQKLLHKNEYQFIQFSLSHLSDFLQGCKYLTDLLDKDVPELLKE